jgi:hypothetical protein
LNLKEIQQTDIWTLYEKGRDFLHLQNTYVETDRNYRFYNGDQWEGAQLGDVEKVQYNIIKPVVKYKLSVILSNLYAIQYSSLNYANRELMSMSERYCKMLNRYAHRVWEQDKLDDKCRTVARDAAINDEGIIYIDFDRDKKLPINEIVKKNDIYFGDETNPNIQEQPYILLRKRMPVSEAIEYAEAHGVGADKLDMIIGDTDTYDESGDASKQEVNNQVTIVFKLYKKDGTVRFSSATKLVEIAKDVDLEISLYPVAHFCWESKTGSARGEGECRHLIPNQIEINKTLMRRILVAKLQSYPRQVADITRITNPEALNTVGGIVKIDGQTVDDVKKVVGTIQPAQMSPDVKNLLDELIQFTRDLAGAGDAATGQIDLNSTTSGRAVLAVQQASMAPITPIREDFKSFIEDVARIWLEYLIAHSAEGISLEDEAPDESIQVVTVPQSVLKELQATVKVDITPKTPFDKFAQEQTIENLLMNGLFSPQRLNELKAYANSLDDDSVSPKAKILEIIEKAEAEQIKIAQINAQAQQRMQRMQQFLSSDVQSQAQQIVNAERQLAMAQQQ